MVIEALTAASTGFFIDAGANIGLFSIVAAKLNPLLQVVAFEPNPRMFAFLSEHIHLNGLSTLRAEPCALSNRDGETRLFLSPSDMSASLLPDFQKDSNPASGALPVKIMTLDSYVRRMGVSGSLVLKVDVEGHEKEVLEGAMSSIAKLKPDIVIEVLKDFDHPSLDKLRNLGYGFYRITHQGLIATKDVGLTKIGEFTFFNYLFTTRPARELREISESIRARARGINLYETSKFCRHSI